MLRIPPAPPPAAARRLGHVALVAIALVAGAIVMIFTIATPRGRR